MSIITLNTRTARWLRCTGPCVGGELVLVEFKRVPGQSSDWVLNHVRRQEVFTAEIEAAGFKKVQEIDLLKENYILRFRKVQKL